MNFSMNGIFSPEMTVLGIGVVWLVTGIVHIAFAFAVWVDSGQMTVRQNRSTFLVGGGLWALATLIGGIMVVAVYWLVHHSTLRPQPPQ